MAERKKPSQIARARSHSRSTPNLATSKISSPNWTAPKHTHQPPTFTPGAPSEPVSPQSEDSDPLSGSSFEREFLSRPASSDSSHSSDSDSSDHDEDDTTTRPHTRTHLSPLSSLSRTQSHVPPPSAPKRPSLLTHASRSKSALGPGAFAPPFYNRPPTPLPPSPSLTSLLRPRHFAAFSSRPTTPDSSDTEGTFSTQAGGTTSRPGGAVGGGLSTTSLRTTTSSTIAQSAATATTVPRASPKVPTYEYYGFVLYLSSSAAFFLYLLWSYLPTPFLHQLGVYYYPDRWWSLAVPGWLVVCLCYIYVALACWNTGYLTLGLTSLECLVDEKGQIAVIDEVGTIVRGEKKDGGKGKERRVGSGSGARGARGRGRARQVMDLGYGRKGIGTRAGKGEGLQELDWRTVWNEGTDAVMDVPIGGVCEILYGAGREGEDVDENEMS